MRALRNLLSGPRTVLSRSLSLFRRSTLDRELDEELESHLEFAIEENRRRGMSEGQARAAALRSFGGVTQVREEVRLREGFPLFEQIGRDLRFGVRQLRKSPGFAVTAILTLALGLGANTAVFSLINGLLLRPLPVPHAGELAVLHYTRTDDSDPNYSFSFPLFRALERRHDVFEHVAAFTNGSFQVRSASGNVNIPGSKVSGEFFEAMEVPPLLGRYLSPQDDRPGGTSTGFGVVISEGFWHRWFNGAPDVVGRRLIIANAPFTVVGVMPKRFIGGDPTQRPDIYAPLWAEPIIDAPYDGIASGFHSWWMRVMARRKAGVSLEQANAALRAASNPILEEAIPDAGWLKQARAHHFLLLAESGSGGFSRLRAIFTRPLVAIFALCAAMLLLACLNLSSLLMARSAARERELATRLALGARRGRLIRQLLVESLLIAVLGTAAGLVAAPVVSRSLAGVILGNDRTATLDTTLDLRVFLFVTVTALAAALLVGFLPALRATSKTLSEQIKAGGQAIRMHERRLLPRMLMALEVALALILVVGAGLLATSLGRLYRRGLGFDPKGVVNLGLNMGKQARDGDSLLRWYHDFADALGNTPQVKGVSFASKTPMDGSDWSNDLRTPLSVVPDVYLSSIAPAYFQTMRIPLLAGRDFRWNDTPASGQKIILSQTAAKRLFRGGNAVGQFVSYGKVHYEVVGIVGDIRYESIREETLPEAYLPITQSNDRKPSYTAVVRIDGPAAPLALAVVALAAKMAPEIPAPVMTTMNSDLDASISSERMMAMLAVFFAGCALLVTAIGLYGTLAYATARRTSEIGIRIALGARRSQVVGLVFRENAWIVAAGSLAGLAIALLAFQALSSFLYGISTRDPWVLMESVAALSLIASAASLLPAARAARIEPMAALRNE